MNAPALARPPRRTQAARSGAMRSRLATAAYEAIASGGLKGLRMRAVARGAGVSPGALLHHFPDKNTLILVAIEQALTLARDDSAAWLDQAAGDPEAVLRAMLAEFRSFFFSDRFWVAMGITIEASKDDELFKAVRSSVALLRKPIYAAWSERLVAEGWSREAAMRAVRSGSAMISGAAIRRFWADVDAITTAIEEEWVAERLAQRSS